MRRLSRRAAIVSAARTPEAGASTGTVVQTLPALTQDAAGTSEADVIGTIVQTLPALTQTATGTSDGPEASPLPAYFQTDQRIVFVADDADLPAYFQTDQLIEDV